MAAVLTLRSAYKPGPPGHGTIDLRLENASSDSIERFRLALTSTVRLDCGPDTGVQPVRQVSGYLELAPAAGFVLAPGEALGITDLSVDHTPHHANDGPTERVRGARGRLDDRRPRRTDDSSSANDQSEARATRVGAWNRRTPSARAMAGGRRRVVRAARLGIGAGAIGGASAVGIGRRR